MHPGFLHHHHRPGKFRCLAYLALALIGWAILNLVQTYHATMCNYTADCDQEAPWLSIMIPVVMMVYGVAMCIRQAYRDYLRRHSGEFDDGN
jgi:hypothetical protein